jgi:hypothetical protein
MMHCQAATPDWGGNIEEIGKEIIGVDNTAT